MATCCVLWTASTSVAHYLVLTALDWTTPYIHFQPMFPLFSGVVVAVPQSSRLDRDPEQLVQPVSLRALWMTWELVDLMPGEMQFFSRCLTSMPSIYLSHKIMCL